MRAHKYLRDCCGPLRRLWLVGFWGQIFAEQLKIV